MIDNNIMKSLGAGSGIDSAAIVKQLTEIERLAPQKRIDTTRDQAKAQISGFASLASAMDTFKASLKAMTDREGLFSKAASFSQSDALVPTKLDTNVQPGNYAVQVMEVARSQSLGFAGFAAPTDAVGEGKLTISLGSWSRLDGVAAEFAQKENSESFSIDIDGSNNSLQGLRDAINAADKGVQASIVFDGESHRLILTAPSGAKNELHISIDESGDSPSNTDSSGLSRFAFNPDVAGFSELEAQSGADAVLIVNGLRVTRETNSVADVVGGLTLDLMKPAPGEVVNITISHDKAFAEQTVRSFVAAYNDFLKEVEPLFGYDKEEEKPGALVKDTLAKSVLSQFRTSIASAVPGLANSNFGALTNVGIRTELNGMLSIDEKDFTKAFAENFADVQKLFAPSTHSSSTEVTVNSFGKGTKAGSYEVVIATPPAKGYLVGETVAAVFPGFDTGDEDYSVSFTVDGLPTSNITLPANTQYASQADFMSALQSAINSDPNLSASGAKVSVGIDADTGALKFTSNRYGASSSVTVGSASEAMTRDFGLGVGLGSMQSGVDVKGTVDGVEAFGLGNVLLPKLGSAAEGLSLIIGENATSSKVSFSRGFAGQMDDVANQFLKSNGLFDARETQLNRTVVQQDDNEKLLEKRMTVFQERLMRQFIAMEAILNGLNSQGGFLENLIDTLPFTAKKR